MLQSQSPVLTKNKWGVVSCMGLDVGFVDYARILQFDFHHAFIICCTTVNLYRIKK